MVLGKVMQRFVERAPVTVMTAMLLEHVLSPQRMNAVFAQAAQTQYEWRISFAVLVDVMSQVVARMHRSVHGVYQRQAAEVGASLKALYDKLRHVEPQTSRALVQHTAREARALIAAAGGRGRTLLPGYRVLVLDGNHLNGSEHRLTALRQTNAGALPGVCLAVLDPQFRTIDDVIPCEDAHTQECRLAEQLLPRFGQGDVVLADRHFCTSDFLFGLAARQAGFVIRQHAGHLRWKLVGRLRRVGCAATGQVLEQTAILTHPQTGAKLTVRRITLRLDHPTRDGETELHLLTTLPPEVADGRRAAELYRERWQLETVFQELTVHLRCEVNTLGYPPAALFGFCVAVACGNLLATLTGTLRAVRGDATVDMVSNYYLAEELAATYRGMMIAVPDRDWRPCREATTTELAHTLIEIARAADLTPYRKHPRGPKLPQPPRQRATRQHVATARLLDPTLAPEKPRTRNLRPK